MGSMDVSVVIPAYNAAAFISACLTSVAAADRTGLTVEIIVVDDHSTDGTARVVEAMIDDHPLPIRLVGLHANVGCGAARAIGLRYATGRIIICVDADDLVVRERFQEQVRVFDDDPAVMLCGGDVIEFDSATGRRGNAVMFPTRDEEIRADMLFYCPIWGCAMAIRRDLLDLVQYPEVRVGDDWLFAFDAAAKGRLASTGKPVTYYRRHETQVTASPSAAGDDVLPVWEHMLRAIGMAPTKDELRLHASCAPYVRRNPGTIPELRSAGTSANWRVWSEKLLSSADGYSRALRDRCARVQQNVDACAHLDGQGATVLRVF